MNTARKKSPRAPSISLDDAIEKATRVYEKERLHPAPVDVIAQDIGYKNASSGAALSALASLRYYGLLVRPREGHLAASKDLENYLYAPSDEIRKTLLKKWIETPPAFLEIIEKYGESLPSDPTLRFDLIGQGFNPTAAESLIAIFKKSAEFVGLYGTVRIAGGPSEQRAVPPSSTSEPNVAQDPAPNTNFSKEVVPDVADRQKISPAHDQIPVRLSQGRRAVLTIPYPLFEEDKVRLKAQIDLLLTEDDL